MSVTRLKWLESWMLGLCGSTTTWIHSSPDVAAGGHKESGMGVEGGLAGMLSYCNYQVTYVPKA